MSTIKINYQLAACLATAVIAVPAVLYLTTGQTGSHLPDSSPVRRGPTELAQLPEPKLAKEKATPRVREEGSQTIEKETAPQDKFAVASAAPAAPAAESVPTQDGAIARADRERDTGLVAPATPAPAAPAAAKENSNQVTVMTMGGTIRFGDDSQAGPSENKKDAQAPSSAIAKKAPAAAPVGQLEIPAGGADAKRRSGFMLPPSAAPDAQAYAQPPAGSAASGFRFTGNARVNEPGEHGRIANNAASTQPRYEPLIATPQEYRDQHETFSDNPVKQTASDPVSTFSLDVDTASYAFVRRALNVGRLPPKDAVRVEEMINYFPYDYATPEAAALPFQPSITITPAPWNAARKLVHIGLKGYALRATERPRANLVFLIDVSGSMGPQDRLPLVKNAFRMLVDELQPDDTVGIVTYASGSGIALKPTKIANKSEILSAIDRLGAGGSTAGAKGIEDAYALAEANFDKAGVNRIILATDGDFNVGITDRGQLKGFIERKRDTGIFLSILGVGQGNYNDATMQALAQNGNGTAAYVDTLNEARKLLVEEASSTLFTIAKDVKIQVEFNPAVVSEYRLIGYETRALKREDFNNDKVDAGDVGSGHTVTAIYEITPAGQPPSADPLRYASPDKAEQAVPSRAAPSMPEYGFFKLRYKLPNEDASKLLSLPLTTAQEKRTLDAASDDVRFSVAVAGFGQLLRGSPLVAGKYSYDDVVALAQSAKGADPFGYRAEFVNLARLAKSAAK